MGQKVNPQGIRLGITSDWKSRWFSKKDLPRQLKEDIEIREMLFKKLKTASIGSVELERSAGAVKVIIKTARPGIIIGRGSQQLLADLVILAEQAGEAAMGEKNGTRSAGAGQDRLFAEVGQRLAHHRFSAGPAETFLAPKAVYPAGPGAEGAAGCDGFQLAYALIQRAAGIQIGIADYCVHGSRDVSEAVWRSVPALCRFKESRPDQSGFPRQGFPASMELPGRRRVRQRSPRSFYHR